MPDEKAINPFVNNSIFWIEVEKVHPNPFQPRREFDEARLRDLADSIKMYGVLQPLVVTRKEVFENDRMVTEYELIAGERRLRASKLAGVAQVPVIIKADADSDKLKLELAIIENLQREDLNPLDRAVAFDKLAREFGLKHIEIAKKIGKSREYVSNTIRLLMLPEEMKQALRDGKISEGHTRPLLMLGDRPAEQNTLFKEIIIKRLSVREAERISRKIAYDRARKSTQASPEILDLEERLTEKLGTRVQIEPKEFGGRVTIDYFSTNDLHNFLDLLNQKTDLSKNGETRFDNPDHYLADPESTGLDSPANYALDKSEPTEPAAGGEIKPDKPADNLYSVSNFTV